MDILPLRDLVREKQRMVIAHLVIDAVDTRAGIETTERIEMMVLVTALEDQGFVVGITQAVWFHERRLRQRHGIVRTVVLLHHYPHLLRIANVERCRVNLYIHLLIATVELDIRMGTHGGVYLHHRFHHAEIHFRHLVIRITVLVDRQTITTALGDRHVLVRKIEPVMRIFAAGVDRVLIVRNVTRREAVQVLVAQ